MKTLDREWRARFERFGRTYAKEHEVSGWSPEGLRRRFKLFQQVVGQLALPQRARVLELGCGAGTYVRYLAALGHAVVGMDYAMASLQRAVNADPQRVGRYVAGDGYTLPFGAKTFDLVICIGVLQALGQPEGVLDEIASVLRPQGVAVIEVLNALEVPRLARRLLEGLGLQRAEVRFYSPFRVRGWLEERNVRLLRRVGVYLPPRSCPWLGLVMDRFPLTRLLETVPGGSLLGAHAVWLVGQRI